MKTIQKKSKIVLSVLAVAALCFVAIAHANADDATSSTTSATSTPAASATSTAAAPAVQDQVQTVSSSKHSKSSKPHHAQKVAALPSSHSGILHGTVTAVTTSSITLAGKGRNSSPTVVTVDDQTFFADRKGDIVAVTDIHVGDRVSVQLASGNGSSTAVEVDVTGPATGRTASRRRKMQK